MGLTVLKPVTAEQYLVMERSSERKHEYYQGLIVAMAGTSLPHNFIVANLIGEIYAHLKGKNCNVLPSDMRVCNAVSDVYMYPDVTIVCDEPELQDDNFDTLINPSVVIEVLNKSTRKRDRGDKLVFYREIFSLKEYILIDSEKAEVETVSRQPDGSWKIVIIQGMDAILNIESIAMQLPLEDVYRNSGV